MAAIFESDTSRRLSTAELIPFEISDLKGEDCLEINELLVDGSKILTKLSYSHIEQLIRIDDQLKRTFYEIECINGTWSVGELKRQIATLYFERTGLSKDKEKLRRMVHQKAAQITPADILKNPIAFEFLDLPVSVILEESDIEQALIDNLQLFLLELGNGFCFESRQKRILIDDEYFYIDLVFYHRILRTHVLIEIKNDEFKHEHIGQLEVYLQYYKHEIMQEFDREPIGILLCTKSKKTMVKYATTAKNNVFVNEYLINLPSKDDLEKLVLKLIRD
jgi:predicted nuclease of restriction endonuclease-like (RecB) superfamily